MANKTKELTPEEQAARIALLQKVSGTTRSPYESIFRRVFTSELGQPLPQEELNLDTSKPSMTSPTRVQQQLKDFQTRVLSTVQGLSARFVDEFVNQTGKLPSEEQISNFLATTINSGFAKKTLTGEITDQQIQSTLVQPAVKALKEEFDTQQKEAQQGSIEEQARKAGEERQSLLSQLAELTQGKAIQSAQEQFGQQRKRLIEEEASLGRLGQPNTIIPESRLEQEQARGLSDLISNLRAKQLGLQSDVTGDVFNSLQRAREFGADLGLRKQTLAEQMRQFNQQQAYNQDLQSYQREQDQQNRALAAELGRQQAQANQPGILDYLNTAFGGLALLPGFAGGLGKVGSIFSNIFKNKNNPTTSYNDVYGTR